MFRIFGLIALTLLAWFAAGFFCVADVPWHWWAVLILLVLACFLTVRLLLAAARGLSRIGF